VRIHVYKDAPSREDPVPYRIFVEAIEKGKRVVFDSDALRVFNHRLTENAQRFDDGRDPRVKTYLEEFASKMISELARNGLIIIEDLPDASDDPYAAVRNMH
jgi:hypothetical protein